MDMYLFKTEMEKLIRRFGKSRISPAFCNELWKVVKSMPDAEFKAITQHLLATRSMGDAFSIEDFVGSREKPKKPVKQNRAILAKPIDRSFLTRYLRLQGAGSAVELMQKIAQGKGSGSGRKSK